MEETIANILKITNWYRNLQKGYSDIDSLLYSRQKLSGWSVNLAELTADYKSESEQAYADRKAGYSQFFINAIENQKVNGTIAKEKAELSSKGLRDAENGFLKIFNRSRGILLQSNEVLSCMSQHISYLKEEKRRTMQGQTGSN